MKYITNNRGDVDCFACAWLVTRFIDPAAEFRFVPSDRVIGVAEAEGAIPYNVRGVELSDNGSRCSFDVFLSKYGLKKPALRRLARIVRGADHKRLKLAPQAAGLLAVTVGLSRMYPDDYDERLEYVLIVYDALYAWCGGRRNPASQPAARVRKLPIKRPARASGPGRRAGR